MKPAKMPEGYFGWALVDGAAGHVVLKDALYNLADDENGDSHEYAKGVLVGVVSTLCACGMEFKDACQLAWQHCPLNIHPKRIPAGCEDAFSGRITRAN